MGRSTSEVERILVVTAHPDDVDFGAGGTVAAWTRAGISVSYCVCTSGEAGAAADADPAQVSAVREAEQREAARLLGVESVSFLRAPDGRVEPGIELRRGISRVIRQVRPQRVLTQSPEINWERIQTSHPDHLAVGHATLAAVYPDARNPSAHPELLAEGLQPWTVPELWLMGGPADLARHVVDISETFDVKVDALAAHRSQISDPAALRIALRFGHRQVAVRHDLGSGRLAEAFQPVRVG